MFWLAVLLATVLVAWWGAWRAKNRSLLEKASRIPGPPALPGLGNALSFMVPSEELSNVFGDFMKQYGDVWRFWLGPDLNIIVSDPDEVKSLLTNNRTSTKGPQYKYMANFLGEGILSGSGPTWRKRRKIAMPNYGRRAVENYEEVFNREAELTLERLRGKEGKTIDIYEDVVRGTTYTVCQTVIGLTREQSLNLPHLDRIITQSHELYLLVFKRMTKWYLQVEPIYWMTRFYQLQRSFQQVILEIGDAIVKHRLNELELIEEEKKMEILQAEGDNKDNTELSIVDRLVLSKQIPEYDEILKEIFTIFTSSQEATAKITSFLLLMMAYHPECQEKLYAEIKSVLCDDETEVTDAHLKQMPYLDMAFKEVLRLFPIGVMLQRTVTEDIKLSSKNGSVVLPAGCSLVVPIFHMQRDERYWENPNAFDPERFGEGKTIPSGYIPFSWGPMDCLGRNFGTKLVKTVSVKVLREFRLTSPEKYQDMRIVLAISVASVNGFPVRLHPRNNTTIEGPTAKVGSRGL